MWNTPSKVRLNEIPELYETESVPIHEKNIHLHFFIGGSDWYITEFDGTDLFFGYAILNGDLQNAEWGYVSFHELKDIRVGGIEVDCECEEFFPVKKPGEIKYSLHKTLLDIMKGD